MTLGETLCEHGQPVASAALKAKYPRACHAPLTDHKPCQGTGERWVKGSEFVRKGNRPCMCLFVEHQHLAVVAEIFQEMVQGKLAKLRKPPTE